MLYAQDAAYLLAALDSATAQSDVGGESVRVGEFHESDGWYFLRLQDGSVRIRYWSVTHDISPSAWASVVATVSLKGENTGRYQAALEFHGDVTTPMVTVTRGDCCESCGRSLGFLHRPDCALHPAQPNSAADVGGETEDTEPKHTEPKHTHYCVEFGPDVRFTSASAMHFDMYDHTPHLIAEG